MIGDRYVVKNDCVTHRFQKLEKGDVLTEKGSFNTDTECVEDAGEYNELVHDVYGYVCDVGSVFATKNLALYDYPSTSKKNKSLDEKMITAVGRADTEDKILKSKYLETGR